jgi:hypothetical protein
MVQELMRGQRQAPMLQLAVVGMEIGVSLSTCQRLLTAARIVAPIEGPNPESAGKAPLIIERFGRNSCQPNQENRRSRPAYALWRACPCQESWGRARQGDRPSRRIMLSSLRTSPRGRMDIRGGWPTSMALSDRRTYCRRGRAAARPTPRCRSLENRFGGIAACPLRRKRRCRPRWNSDRARVFRLHTR